MGQAQVMKNNTEQTAVKYLYMKCKLKFSYYLYF